ncbi:MULTISPECIES: hypothetical protein [unclassified Sphingopyxis]|jgi:hypothetical protein|uniref:hypothetical protein n=1 Tax=unclassified Sphingopyxis TaxID=2614943 RepID=UPI00285A6D29|nr:MULTISPECIES: hypothetical protein [unclassified Sphingopyxis]MDR6831939.1 hypothetical protein [Sphingopyxis sp. BE122]MDR7227681.1 hypothetical protein [Sphingopyxis sp. BE259]
MTDPTDEMRLHALWQGREAALAPLPLDEIKHRAARFGDAVRQRNRREYGATAAVVVFFALYAIFLPELLLKLGSLLIIAAALFVAWQLGRRTSRPDAEAETQDVRGYYRARLVREEHMLARVGRWYLAPFVPGLLIFLAGLARGSGLANPLVFLSVAAFQLLIFGGIWWLNHRAAATLRTQIDRLDRAHSHEGDLS